MYTDADIEMAEAYATGQLVANGVCVVCEDVLDPMNPRWTDSELLDQNAWPNRSLKLDDPTEIRKRYREMLGPISDLGDRHVNCEGNIW